MKTSIVFWLATMCYLVGGMAAIGVNSKVTFIFLFMCAVLMAVFSMNMMKKEKGEVMLKEASFSEVKENAQKKSM